jgi:hypothetical protein
MDVERKRVATFGRPEEGIVEASPWYRWGPYLSERQWGTVREDYSADGDAWRSFPFDQARSRAYRWGEDGIAGICDAHQRLCLAVALWNGRDPILKERLFGLSGPEGSHGEDAKEVWWHVDAVPSHAWLRYRYHYPQAAFPYEELRAAARAAGRDAPEPELVDTGVFDDDRYWSVDVSYAKAAPDDILLRVRVTNAGPEEDVLHVLPTLWFRNTWSWGDGSAKPELRVQDGALVARHSELGAYRLLTSDGPGGPPRLLVCENESNAPLLWGTPGTTPYPKDGIGDHVIHGAPTVSPDGVGTKGAAHHELTVAPGATVEVQARLTADGVAVRGRPLGKRWAAIFAAREAEADTFHAALVPAGAGPDEALVLRRALSGMIWCKQHYDYDVARWLGGDPAGPPPPTGRGAIRNGAWRHLDAADVLSMPDSWEYPWFATWDLAFHAVPLAHVDPAFAKSQLLVLVREWFQHPNGALPAYEWSFDDVNPPVHAWAALRVYSIDGRRDRAFLERVFHKLLLNFAWWVNRKDAAGDNLFEGGFLGLDNIGPFDRSKLPVSGRLEQSDATAWMAFYCLSMAAIALELAQSDEVYVDLAAKFLLHFDGIARAMNEQGLWDDDDGFYFDRLVCPSGEVVPIEVRSIVGLVPLLASLRLERGVLERVPTLGRRLSAIFERTHGSLEEGLRDLQGCGHLTPGPNGDVLLSVVSPARLRRILGVALADDRFLSPHGLRSLSKWHQAHPFSVTVDGVTATVGYEPGESRSGLFGGNSNWRGPVWFPFNQLVIEALERYHAVLGDALTVELPAGSGNAVTLDVVADDLRARLISLFLPTGDGRLPCFGESDRFGRPGWREPLFFEYFHGDTGVGLGASHQTGWTGLVADLVLSRRRG